MNQTDTLDHQNNFAGLELNSDIRAYLLETAKWAKFISIVGFVMAGFMIIGALSFGVMLGSVIGSGMEGGMGAASMSSMFSVIYIVFALIFVIPVYFLFRFSQKMLAALKHDDDIDLTESFKNLKSHYKFVGIYFIIMLGFYALGFLLAAIGGVATMF